VLATNATKMRSWYDAHGRGNRGRTGGPARRASGQSSTYRGRCVAWRGPQGISGCVRPKEGAALDGASSGGKAARTPRAGAARGCTTTRHGARSGQRLFRCAPV
jgi:hypothetical protein